MTSSSRPPSADRRGGAAVHPVAIGLAVAVAVVFVAGTFAGQLDHLQGDWEAFDRAAGRAIGGDWRSAYTISRTESLPFLYPPYVLWFLLPLAALPRVWSFAAVLAASITATAAAIGLVVRLLPRVDTRRLLFAVAVTASFGPVYQMIRYGQLSPLYLAVFAAVAWACQRGRPTVAGFLVAVLAVKPNLLLPVVAVLVAARAWPILRAASVGIVALVASTLPFGFGPWAGFLDAVAFVGNVERTSTLNPGIQVTMLAALRVAFGGGAASVATTLLWVGASVVLGVALLRHWWRAPVLDLRCWATVVLFVVAANPRLYFYDAIVLVLPALAWWLDPGDDTATRRRVTATVLVATWVAGCVVGPLMALLPAVGPLTALWLALELGRGHGRGGSPGPGSDEPVSSSRSGSATTST